MLDVSELHQSYNRLPTAVQKLAAPGFYLFMDALERQHYVANAAVLARYKLVLDLMQGANLSASQLAPNEATQPAHEYLMLVGDEQVDPVVEQRRELQADLEEYLRTLLLHTDDSVLSEVQAEPLPEPVTPHVPSLAAAGIPEMTSDDCAEPSDPSAPISPWLRIWASAASIIATAALALLIWRPASQPPGATVSARQDTAASQAARVVSSQSINRSVQAGDMTMIVCQAEYTEDEAKMHIHLLNSSNQAQPAQLRVNNQAGATPASSAMVPGKASQHRVIRVNKQQQNDVPLSIELRGSNHSDILHLDLQW